ncbi:MAG: hypothetical protein KJP04_01080, partial [Arenicella sp.]|nr:hypothetical protein [Arenicella sp.]
MLSATFAAMAVLMVGNAHALGLGNLEVESNLDQPLRGSIELRVAEGDDIDSISVSIASRDEFDRLGISYPDYLKDITINFDTYPGGSVLRISSENVVIREPFIQFLVRVDWSGGSFLREYTALIDPPTYAAETPRAVAAPQAVG